MLQEKQGPHKGESAQIVGPERLETGYGGMNRGL